MEILPPRRPGRLGAFSVGSGVQGPSGGFSLGASSLAPRAAGPSPRLSPPSPGSISPSPSPSVSEQVALKQSTSQTAAAATVPAFSRGGAYSSNQPVVGVQSYVPPPGTPAITQPPKQPNESKTVQALANQIPQNPMQVMQKVLARDAGIAVPVPGPAPIIPMSPALPKYPPPPQPPPMRNPVVSPSIAPQRPAPFAPPSSGGAFSVSATTAANIPNRQPGPVSPVITPKVMETATLAASATVAAKIAKQKAANAISRAAVAAQTAVKLKQDAAAAAGNAKTLATTARDRFEQLQATQQETAKTLADQTASADAKAKAQADLRDAQEAAALAAKQAGVADATAQQLTTQATSADAEAQNASAQADVAQVQAKEKTTDALSAQADAIDTQRAADQAQGGGGSASGSAQALVSKGAALAAAAAAMSDEELAVFIAAATSGRGYKDLRPEQIAEALPFVQAEKEKRDIAAGKFNQSGSKTSGTTIALALGGAAILLYALTRGKSQSFNEAPLIAELDEE